MNSKDKLGVDLEHSVRRWNCTEWHSSLSTNNINLRGVTECLGLGLSASSTRHGILKFDNPHYRKLSGDLRKLSKKPRKEKHALLKFAADPTSLNQELEDLLASYGPAIWGKGADRSCLLTPDPTKTTYNKDLFYEEPRHQDILKILLHRWVIVISWNSIRNKTQKLPESPRKRKRKSNAHLEISDDEDPETSPIKRSCSKMLRSRRDTQRELPEPSHPPSQSGMETIYVIPTSMHRSLPAPGTASGRLQSQPNTLPDNGLGGRAESLAVRPEPFPRESLSTADLHLLQCDVTAQLFAFFYPSSTVALDETSLFVCMRKLWLYGEPLFRAEIPKTHFDLVSNTLTAWIDECEATATLRRPMQAGPGSRSELVGRVLAMNKVRATRWKEKSLVDGLSTEDLLCMAFRAMTNTEGLETLFRDGLARLELGMSELLCSIQPKIVITTSTSSNSIQLEDDIGSDVATSRIISGSQTTIHHPASPHQGVVGSTGSSRIKDGGPLEELEEMPTEDVATSPKSGLVILKVKPSSLALLGQHKHETSEAPLERKRTLRSRSRREGTESTGSDRFDLHNVLAHMLDESAMPLADIQNVPQDCHNDARLLAKGTGKNKRKRAVEDGEPLGGNRVLRQKTQVKPTPTKTIAATAVQPVQPRISIGNEPLEVWLDDPHAASYLPGKFEHPKAAWRRIFPNRGEMADYRDSPDAWMSMMCWKEGREGGGAGWQARGTEHPYVKRVLGGLQVGVES